MTNQLSNVIDEYKESVYRNKLALELSDALISMFTITNHFKSKRLETNFTVLYCKPTQTIAESLLIDREVLAIIANFDDLQARVFAIAKDTIENSKGRLDPRMLIVVHADRRGDSKLRSWGRENGIRVVPIFRAKGKAIPPTEILKRNLAQELFSSDPFQVTGPVVNDMDFYGRGNESIELLRQLQSGRIRAVFGVRKIGKTSLINRVIKLAQDAGEPNIAMVDCSVRDFYRLDANTALKALAKVSKMAATRGYAHITDALKRTDQELVPVFDDLWNQTNPPNLTIIFDEIDYITPDSPVAPEWWQKHFNDFWREFRVLVQEAQRHNMVISILVSGVSSRSFRVEHINGVENAVLHFVPEDYLAPFARTASNSMIRDLGNRCGLHFTSEARELLAEVCGDFPFWMRMAGSHIHRAIDIDSRPVDVTPDMIEPLLSEFSLSEGAEITRVALENLQRVYPEVIAQLRGCISKKVMPLMEGRLLSRYGLAKLQAGNLSAKSSMILAGLTLLDLEKSAAPTVSAVAHTPASTLPSLQFSDSEWAEELAVMNRRQSILEKRLRDFIRFALKLSVPKTENWLDKILQALPQKRRNELMTLSADTVMNKLFWLELEAIIKKNWPVFEQTFGDKNVFETSMKVLNDRPYAHAKPVDFADMALYRKHLAWLEERVSS